MEESVTAYLDANVFIHAAVTQGAVGEAARTILAAVKERRLQAVTSAVSFDETMWIVRKLKGAQAGVDVGGAFLSLECLGIVEIDRDVLSEALNAIKQLNLKPHDATHFATANMKGADCIVSEDADFDGTGIKRYGIIEFARKRHL